MKIFKLFINTIKNGVAWGKRNITPAYYVAIIIFSYIIINISFALNEKWHENTNYASPGIISNYLGAAITSNEYGRHGYIGYTEVRNIIRDSEIIDNNVLQKAMAIKNLKSNDIYSMGGMGIGYIDFCRIAFFLYGTKVSSLLYLYLSFFCISVVVFFIEYRQLVFGNIILMLFLIAHYVSITAIPYLDHNVGVIYNPRLILMLGLLPLIHICFSINNKRKNILSIIFNLLQSLIIIFVFHVRSNALWIIIFVFSFLIIYSLRFLYKSFPKETGFYLLKKIDNKFLINLFSKYWPLMPVICLFFIYKLFIPLNLDPINKSSPFDGKSHAVWSGIFNGFALHPDIRKEYVGEREFTFDIEKDNYFKYICDEVIYKDNFLKGSIRRTLCDKPELIIGISKLRFKYQQIVTYEANDQDCLSAGFNWLKKNGYNEYQFLNLNSKNNVYFNNAFTWFQSNKKNKLLNLSEFEIKNLRDFNWDYDFNSGEFEKIHYNILLDVVRTHPLEILELTFFIKPLQYIYIFTNSFFNNFLSFTSILMFLFVLLFIYGCNKISHSEIKYALILLSLMFLFSLSPYIITYPGRHVMFDQIIIVYMVIYFLFISLFRYIISTYTIVFRIKRRIT